MNSTLSRILHPRRARARRHVETTWNRLLTGDTSVIADIPESCRSQVLDNAWNTVRVSAWDAVNNAYSDARWNGAHVAFHTERTS